MNQRSITKGLEIHRRDAEYAEGRRVKFVKNEDYIVSLFSKLG